jgi:hypothetical protein
MTFRAAHARRLGCRRNVTHQNCETRGVCTHSRCLSSMPHGVSLESRVQVARSMRYADFSGGLGSRSLEATNVVRFSRMTLTASAGIRNERPTCAYWISPVCSRRYIVILETRSILETSATVRNCSRGGSSRRTGSVPRPVGLCAVIRSSGSSSYILTCPYNGPCLEGVVLGVETKWISWAPKPPCSSVHAVMTDLSLISGSSVPAKLHQRRKLSLLGVAGFFGSNDRSLRGSTKAGRGMK